MSVNPGMALFGLARLGSVWVNAEVPEAKAALMRPGASATARASAFPETLAHRLHPNKPSAAGLSDQRNRNLFEFARGKPSLFFTQRCGTRDKPIFR